MESNYYKKYEPIFDAWYIKRMLGEGSFGKVFEIERKELGTTYRAALKCLTIPQSQSEIKSVMADGMSKQDVTAYFEGVVHEIVNEFKLMAQLKGNSNIVSYEDHKLVKHEDGVGWDILIKMELLTPLFDYIEEHNLTKRDVIKMGIDLCKALELCQKYNIIHRDVKPENIFMSPNGDYKLGDFGIARTVEKTTSGLSRKGTFLYMAPEIYLGKPYGSTVDIYSLGLVMYRLLNDNRAPFMPPYPQPITHNDREDSLIKRVSGMPLPKPVNAEGRLVEIIMKACEHDPEKRYHSAGQMRMELEAIYYTEQEGKIIYPEGDLAPVKSVEYVESKDYLVKTEVLTSGESSTSILDDNKTAILSLDPDSQDDKTEILDDKPEEEKVNDENGNEETSTEDDKEQTPNGEGKGSTSNEKTPSESAPDRKLTPPEPPNTEGNQESKNKKIPLIVAAAIVCIILVIALVMPKGVKDITGIEETTKMLIGETLKPTYLIEPAKHADKTIEFSVDDESIISVNDKGEITSKKVGETILVMKAGRYSEKVTIIVEAKVKEITNVDSVIEITEGNTFTIDPELSPAKYEDSEINYDIIDNDIAVINKEGRITAKNPGTTKLVIRAGGCKKTVKIVVEEYTAPTYHNTTKNYSKDTEKEKATAAPTEPPTEAPTVAPTEPPTEPSESWEVTIENHEEEEYEW